MNKKYIITLRNEEQESKFEEFVSSNIVEYEECLFDGNYYMNYLLEEFINLIESSRCGGFIEEYSEIFELIENGDDEFYSILYSFIKELSYELKSEGVLEFEYSRGTIESKLNDLDENNTKAKIIKDVILSLI